MSLQVGISHENRQICEGCQHKKEMKCHFQTKKCEDIDECTKFAGHVCDLSAECKNTIGSFVCKCKNGFKLAADGRRCEGLLICYFTLEKTKL